MTVASLRLLLIRHAKAGEGVVDAERQLTDRGRRDARALGEWLAQQQLVPDVAVVSPAVRAQQTWQWASAALDPARPAETDTRVYDNTVDALLAVIHESAPELGSVAVVGHNPSIELLARALDDGSGDAGARATLTSGFPTCGIAVFTLNTPFADLNPSNATLTHFAIARA